MFFDILANFEPKIKKGRTLFGKALAGFWFFGATIFQEKAVGEKADGSFFIFFQPLKLSFQKKEKLL